MAALLRSQDARDWQTAIRKWQSQQSRRQRGGPVPEPDEKSAVARLTTCLDTLFREIMAFLSDKGKFPRDIFISLDRSRSCFSLWSDGYGVADGILDDKFQRSQQLRQVTMKTLTHLSSTLTDRLVPVVQISNPKTKGLCDQVSDILEEVRFSHFSDDSSSDSSSECSPEDVHELAEDLKTDVECLIELDQMIRDPATDLEPQTTEASVPIHSWLPYQAFADRIENRFPGADKLLSVSLGTVSCHRFLRCQTERNTNQVHPAQAESHSEMAEGSKFHDSGLGSSLSPVSSYADTIMSYGDGNHSIRIPRLSAQAKNGEPFSCIACGRSVTMTTNSHWKRHLYLDLQPYVCLDTSCRRSNSTFPSRTKWIQHLALDHVMEPEWKQIQCPLCGDETGSGKLAIITHLGRHLEEISLSALPTALDSETNSEVSDSDSSDIHKASQGPGEILRSVEAVEVASQGKSREQPRIPLDSMIFDGHVVTGGLGNLSFPPPPIMPVLKPAVGDEMVRKTLGNWELQEKAPAEDALQQQKLEMHEAQIRNQAKVEFDRRAAEMTAVQEEAKREIARARAEAEEAAYKRLKAEQKSEEDERARLYAQAMAAAEEAVYKRIKAERAEQDQLRAELMAMHATRQAEAEARDRAEAETRARILEVEGAIRHQMDTMRAVQEETRREIEKAKVEAERSARERLEAERRTEMDRARKHAEAMAAAEYKARIRFEAEINAAAAKPKAKQDGRKLRAELKSAEERKQADEAKAKAAAATVTAAEAERLKNFEGETPAKEAEMPAEITAAVPGAEEPDQLRLEGPDYMWRCHGCFLSSVLRSGPSCWQCGHARCIYCEVYIKPVKE